MARVTVQTLNRRRCLAIETEPFEHHLAKQVPGAKRDPARHAWIAPATRSNALVAANVLPRLDGDAEFHALLDSRRADAARWLRDQVDPATLPAGAWSDIARDTAGATPGLYPHQVTGAMFLATAQGALLGDQMGAGKTATTIAALKLLIGKGIDPCPVLVVCPATVMRVWRDEIARWTRDTPVTIVEGSAAKRRKIIDAAPASGFLIISWQSLGKHTRFAPFYGLKQVVCDECTGRENGIKLDRCETHDKELNAYAPVTVIADEVHRAKSARSQQTRALWGVSTDASYRFALTGTPVVNNMEDLWSILRFVAPDDFPSKSRFLDRYALQTWNAFGGREVVGVSPEHRTEFDSLFLPRFRRMLKEVVLPYLPPKVRETRYVEMNRKQTTAYKAVAKDLLLSLDGSDGKLFLGSHLPRVTRSMQFASAYGEIESDDSKPPNDAGEQPTKLTLTLPSSKIEALYDFLTIDVPDEPVVVFAQSRKLIELAYHYLDERGIYAPMITGTVPTAQRASTVEDFQERRVRVVLCTIAAAGEGLTLTAARHAVFLQRSWSMKDNAQAEDRLHRPGAEVHESIVITDFVSPGTIEEHQIDVVNGKAEKLEDICHDVDTLRKLMLPS